MPGNLTQLNADIAAQTKLIAASDLVALQTAAALVANGNTTVPQMVASLTGLPTALIDPARAATAANLLGGWQSANAELAQMIADATTAANA